MREAFSIPSDGVERMESPLLDAFYNERRVRREIARRSQRVPRPCGRVCEDAVWGCIHCVMDGPVASCDDHHVDRSSELLRACTELLEAFRLESSDVSFFDFQCIDDRSEIAPFLFRALVSRSGIEEEAVAHVHAPTADFLCRLEKKPRSFFPAPGILSARYNAEPSMIAAPAAVSAGASIPGRCAVWRRLCVNPL